MMNRHQHRIVDTAVKPRKGAVRSVIEINGEVLVSSEVQNGDMKLVNNGNVAFVETWFGVKVEFKPYYLGVRIPSYYESKVAGLCGNYDGDRIPTVKLKIPGKLFLKSDSELLLHSSYSF